jgi:hypothetical protein
MGRYSKSLGMDPEHKVSATFSLTGAAEWAVSKAPALLGGKLADWVFNQANLKFPNYKRGVDFVGCVGVIGAGYGLHVAVSKFSPENSRMADKITDGMVGRCAPNLLNVFKNLLGMKPANARAAQGTGSLDGDRQAVMEVAQLLHASPETTDQLAKEMVEIMRKDNVQLNDAGAAAVARSMRQGYQRLAQGAF